MPNDHKIAIAVHGHTWVLLVIGGVVVYLDLATLGYSLAVITLGLDAEAAGVAAGGVAAFPDYDKVAVAVVGDGRQVLATGGVAVNLEIVANGLGAELGG